MTNFNINLHDKISLLAKGTTTILDTNIVNLNRETNHKRKKMMMSMLEGSKLLSITISNIVTTEENQSQVISNLLQGLKLTYKTCEQYGVHFDSTNNLLAAWESGLNWAQKREISTEWKNSTDDLLNLFEDE